MTIILPGQDITSDMINNLEHGPWTTYTPALTSSGTAPAAGNAVFLASYHQVGKRVHVVTKVTFGTTTTFGTGVLYLGLPVAQSANMNGQVLGSAFAFDTSAPVNRVAIAFFDGTNQRVFFRGATDGALIGATAPWTWANGDQLYFSGTYEAA